MLIRHLRSGRGITLIELMLVVVIIGIIAALAIPRFMSTTAATKQAEAKTVLKQIYQSQRAYFQEHDRYWIPPGGTVANSGDALAFRTLGVEIMNSARYSYTITGTATLFVARATCSTLDDDPTLDEWSIDDAGFLLNISDDARH